MQRLIDANALTKRYQQMMEYEHNYNAAPISWVAAFEEFIDSIENAQTVDGWISVKDRMPEKNGDYLAYTRDGIVWPYYFTAISGVWEDALGYSTDTVTHWMSLPEPPKEGKPECD